MTQALNQPISGMSDIGPPEITFWQYLEESAQPIFSRYAFQEIRTPILEYTHLFERSLGDTTDVVQKEMYTFEDRSGKSITLRPEGTAGVIRYASRQLSKSQEQRLYYCGPMFRRERPQAGRKRQFHQLGAEYICKPNPLVDAELIALQVDLFLTWGLSDIKVEINTRGQPEDQPQIAKGLKEALLPHHAELCEECQRRIDKNIFRILDCKNTKCKEIVSELPPITSFLMEESTSYYREMLRALKLWDIPVEEKPHLIRGLDYYQHTIWEISHQNLGAQNALAGGGRYTIALSNTTVEGVGFAIGLERVHTVLTSLGIEPKRNTPPLTWIVSQGEEPFNKNILLLKELRKNGISCRMDYGARKMKTQFKAAHNAGAKHVVIHGEEELQRGILQLKDMETGEQKEVTRKELFEELITINKKLLA